MRYKCLSIAGFDGSGGAGIQADLKTFSALGCYGMTVLTALPIQNTCGVRKCYELPPQAIHDQLAAIFDDITPDSIKIGMVFSESIINVVSQFLQPYASSIPIVLDPVMLAKSGDPLLDPGAMDALKTTLIPLATLLTPNLPEAYELAGYTQGSMHSKSYNLGFPALSEQLLALGPQAILLKGGHGEGNTSNDLFVSRNSQSIWLNAPRIHTKNTHGTGCTLSAAIASFLAQKYSLLESCQLAKDYVQNALLAAQHEVLGHGKGPLHHFYRIWPNTKHINT